MRPTVIIKTFQTWRAFEHLNQKLRMRQTPDGQLEFADKPRWITADILFKKSSKIALLRRFCFE
jgi:hypothetical protein